MRGAHKSGEAGRILEVQEVDKDYKIKQKDLVITSSSRVFPKVMSAASFS